MTATLNLVGTGELLRAPCTCDDGSFCPAEAQIRTCRRCRFQWAEAVARP